MEIIAAAELERAEHAKNAERSDYWRNFPLGSDGVLVSLSTSLIGALRAWLNTTRTVEMMGAYPQIL